MTAETIQNLTLLALGIAVIITNLAILRMRRRP